MRVTTVLHQQASQIKWHVLASLALIMVLPLEEATVSALEGDGFWCGPTIIPAILLGPLLAGLIACANVQADMDDRRYAFWRSKPVGVKRFIAIKYVVGFALAFIIQTCPMFFAAMTSIVSGDDEAEWVRNAPLNVFYLFPLLLSFMTYSLCFASNIIVRKTARSWLIGVLAASLVLLIPFILPLGLKDVGSDVLVWASRLYAAIVLGTGGGAFVFALFAAQYNWRLKTNLKGFLWGCGGFLFAIMMFVSHQVASLTVLDEHYIADSARRTFIRDIMGKVLLSDNLMGCPLRRVEVTNGRLFVRCIGDSPEVIASYVLPQGQRKDGHVSRLYFCDPPYQKVGDDFFSFSIHAERPDNQEKRFFQGLEVRSYRFAENTWQLVSSLDISNLIRAPDAMYLHGYISMHFLNGKVLAQIYDQYIAVDVSEVEEMRLLDVGDLPGRRLYSFYSALHEHQNELAIPVINLEGLTPEERVQLTLLLGGVFVEVVDGRIVIVDIENEERGLARFEMTRFENGTAHFILTDVRPFTILERIGGEWGYRLDVVTKDGKLYLCDNKQVSVFDIHSGRRIRKIGHFVRLHHEIQQVLVLDSGDILLNMREDLKRDNRSYRGKNYLCLLKAP